jgi:hypothetical protein
MRPSSLLPLSKVSNLDVWDIQSGRDSIISTRSQISVALNLRGSLGTAEAARVTDNEFGNGTAFIGSEG